MNTLRVPIPLYLLVRSSTSRCVHVYTHTWTLRQIFSIITAGPSKPLWMESVDGNRCIHPFIMPLRRRILWAFHRIQLDLTDHPIFPNSLLLSFMRDRNLRNPQYLLLFISNPTRILHATAAFSSLDPTNIPSTFETLSLVVLVASSIALYVIFAVYST